MLVITRKVGQAFYVGETRIVLGRTSHGQTRIGVEAPKSIRVLRAELVERGTHHGGSGSALIPRSHDAAGGLSPLGTNTEDS